MRLYLRASNAFIIELENGDKIEIHEFDNTLSFSAMPNHLKVTAHNAKTLKNNTLGTNYQISLSVTIPREKALAKVEVK